MNATYGRVKYVMCANKALTYVAGGGLRGREEREVNKEFT